MKNKEKVIEKKLLFEKMVIVSLGKKDMMKIKGGWSPSVDEPGTSNGATCDKSPTTL